MKSSLFKGLSAEDTKELERQFKAAYLLRQQIVKNLLAERESIVQSMVYGKEEGQDWTIKQAISVARIREIDRLSKLF